MSRTDFSLISVPPSDANQSVDSAYKTLENLLSLGSDSLADISRFPVPEFKVGIAMKHSISCANLIRSGLSTP